LEKAERQINEAVIHMPPKSRSFIVFHPSYGYFAKDYKLKQYAIEVDGKEPKPKDLAKLIQMGRKNNVKIVFVQPQFSKRAAQTIAKDLGAIIVETDPLSADFMGNIKKLVNAIREASKK
jgi:zinc transport system substrate-binding protein